MRIYVEGVGLLGPGLNGWQASRALLTGVRRISGRPPS